MYFWYKIGQTKHRPGQEIFLRSLPEFSAYIWNIFLFFVFSFFFKKNGRKRILICKSKTQMIKFLKVKQGI